MSKVTMGVVGDRDVIMAFQALGISGAAATTRRQAQEGIHRLVQEGCGIIFVTETALKEVPDIAERYLADPKVAIIPIPGTAGTEGLGMDKLYRAVEKAIGSNILLHNKGD